MARPARYRAVTSVRTWTLNGWTAYPVPCFVGTFFAFAFAVAWLGEIVLGRAGPPILAACWLFGCN